MVILKNLAPLHRLRIFGKNIPAELAHGPQLFRKPANFLVALASLPLLEGLDQGVHLTLGLLVLNREEHTGLNVHQVRRHSHKFAGYLQVHLLPLFQVCQVLVQDQRNGDVLNLDFIFTQQEQDQVKGPLKILQRLCRLALHHFFQFENRIVQNFFLPYKPTTRQNRSKTQLIA